MESTSFSLLERLSQPESDNAWSRFAKIYAPLIFHWGKAQGLNATDAADLVQDVFSILVTKLIEYRYDPDKRFRSWLCTITRNKAIDFHRRNEKRNVTEQEETIQEAIVDLFEEAEYHNFVSQRALKLIQNEFKEETWNACWLQVVDGKKAAQVARELKISVNKCYLAKSRVLARLRGELEGLIG